MALNSAERVLERMLSGMEEPATQQLTLYIPDKDKDDNRIESLDNWIKQAQAMLTSIGGGTTSLPPADGTWLNEESNETIYEKTKIIYTYVYPDRLAENLASLREFLHRFGRETNQGEVVFEFNGRFYRIRKYDPK